LTVSNQLLENIFLGRRGAFGLEEALPLGFFILTAAGALTTALRLTGVLGLTLVEAFVEARPLLAVFMSSTIPARLSKVGQEISPSYGSLIGTINDTQFMQEAFI